MLVGNSTMNYPTTRFVGATWLLLTAICVFTTVGLCRDLGPGAVMRIGEFRRQRLNCFVRDTAPNILLVGRRLSRASFRKIRLNIMQEIKSLHFLAGDVHNSSRQRAAKRLRAKLVLLRRNLLNCQNNRPPYQGRANSSSSSSLNSSTQSIPEAPTNLIATVLSSTEIHLAWVDNSTNETGFKVERSMTAEFSGFISVSTPAHSSGGVADFFDSNLVPDTTYYYRIRANNMSGDSDATPSVSATTSRPPVGNPPATESKTVGVYALVPQALSVYVRDLDRDTLTITVPSQTLMGKKLVTTSSTTVNGSGYLHLNYASGDAPGSDQFSYTVSDGQNEASGVVSLEVGNPPPGVWLPPAGIPRPEFGIEEDQQMYAGKLYDYDDWVYSPGTLTNVKTTASYRNAGNGPYTHYIDAASPNAIDSEYHSDLPANGPFGQYAPNVYGSPEKPRRTVPMDLAPGSVVEVHSTIDNGFNDLNLSGVGSKERPIIIRGIGLPNIGHNLDVGYYGDAEYLIVDGLHFLGGGVLGRQDGNSFTNAHVVVRNCEFSRDESGGGTGIVSYTSNSLTNVIFYHNSIHDNGVWDPDAATGDQDNHGIGVGNVTHIWIVDNEMFHNSGDGIQINGTAENTRHIYVGRNVSHHNKQSGFWTKSASDVIFSQNIAYGHRPSSSAPGPGMGFQYDPMRVWFLFNRSHDNEHGIECGSGNIGGRDEFYFIGNVLYRNTNGFNLNGLNTPQPAKLIGNTIYDTGAGIRNGYYSVKLEIVNNIIAESTYQIYLEPEYGSAGFSTVSNNLFEGPVQINWDYLYTSLSQFETATGQCGGCLSADPQFTDPSNDNFHLSSTSPARDAAIVSSAYDRFYQLYAIDIAKDADLVKRPQGSIWDLGAFEYSE